MAGSLTSGTLGHHGLTNGPRRGQMAVAVSSGSRMSGRRAPITGTMIGRVFTSGEVHVRGNGPMVVSVPLTEGSCPIGVLEFDVESWDAASPELLDPIVAVFVMSWAVKSRYTDGAARGRRSRARRNGLR
jgi:hypothetical protein